MGSTITVCLTIVAATAFLAWAISVIHLSLGKNRPWLLWAILAIMGVTTTVFIIDRIVNFAGSMTKICLFIAATTFIIWVFIDVLLKNAFKKSSWFLRVLFALVCGAAIYYPLIENIMDKSTLNGFYTLLLSFYRSARLFFVDGDFPAVQTALKAVFADNYDSSSIFFVKISERVCYQGITILAYLWAPITTATFLASIFQNFMAHVRLRTVGLFMKRYIFSELNDKSLALAKDIRETENKKLLTRMFKRVIVFHDVYRKHEETSTELLDEAKKIGALCFKRDVAKLSNGALPWVKTEYFVIGENESENIKQALELVKKYKKHSNKKVYVWARSPESAIIFDSVQITDDASSCNFVLRRIDDVEIFVWNTLKDANLFDESKIYVDKKGNKFISILIVGMGEYGIEFLKTATWMYQFDDITLEITAIDLKDTAEKTLRYQCPEMMNFNGKKIPGESQYDIKFVESVDIFTDDLVNKLMPNKRNNTGKENDSKNKNGYDKELLNRLMRVRQVFVTLGDDDLNIRGAIEMRQLFDMLHYDKLVEAAPDSLVKSFKEKDVKAKYEKDDNNKNKTDKQKEEEIKNFVNEEFNRLDKIGKEEYIYNKVRPQVLKELAKRKLERTEMDKDAVDKELEKIAQEDSTLNAIAKEEIKLQAFSSFTLGILEEEERNKHNYYNLNEKEQKEKNKEIKRAVEARYNRLLNGEDNQNVKKYTLAALFEFAKTEMKKSVQRECNYDNLMPTMKKFVDVEIANRVNQRFNALTDEEKEFYALNTGIEVQIEKKIKSLVASQLKKDYDDFCTPEICAPVYDIVKTENMIGPKNENKKGKKTEVIQDKRLRCYENTPYNINFEGSFEKQYNYETVVRENLENIALAYHLKWSALDNYDAVVDNFNKYNQYEYYRRSSISQAMHIQLLDGDITRKDAKLNPDIIDAITCDHYKKKNEGLTEELINAVKILRKEIKKSARAKNKKPPTLPPAFNKAIGRLQALDQCGNCNNCTNEKCKSQRRATIEHIRWNAYMRSIGYRAPQDDSLEVKLPRAKVHCNIVEYDRLDDKTKAKDGIT